MDVILGADCTSSGSTSSTSDGNYFGLLGDLGWALASGAEAGETLDSISAGSLDLEVSNR